MKPMSAFSRELLPDPTGPMTMTSDAGAICERSQGASDLETRPNDGRRGQSSERRQRGAGWRRQHSARECLHAAEKHLQVYVAQAEARRAGHWRRRGGSLAAIAATRCSRATALNVPPARAWLLHRRRGQLLLLRPAERAANHADFAARRGVRRLGRLRLRGGQERGDAAERDAGVEKPDQGEWQEN